jgi:uncharacterized protein (DUF433 family)
MVSVVLDNLASCASINEVVRLYPTLKHQDIIAAIAYAAELARGHVVMRFKTQEI